MNPDNNTDLERPVAYDPQGRPLYYRPEVSQAPITPPPAPAVPAQPEIADPFEPKPYQKPAGDTLDPQVSVENNQGFLIAQDPRIIEDSIRPMPKIPESIKARHDESATLYPDLNLGPAEYVVIRLKRHPIGIMQIWLVTFAVFAALLVSTVFITNTISLDAGAKAFAAIAGLGMSVLTFVFGALTTRIYQMNKFFVTNERVINHIQRSLFSMRKQSIGLDGVEDVSYRQSGILQTILRYGSVRLATVGDETTYRFNYVQDPVSQIAVINQTVQQYDLRRGANTHRRR